MTTSYNSLDRTLSILVLLATISVIAINFIAAAGYINGVTPDVISDRYPTVLTPAGYAFTIWSAIYVGLIAFSIYQALPSKLGALRGLRVPYILSCLMNIAWIYSWHYGAIGNSVAVICILLMSVTFVMARAVSLSEPYSAILVKAPFGLYAGWVTVATIVNFAVDLRFNEIGWSDMTWSVFGVAMLVVACLLAAAVRIRLRNFLYPLSIAWAATAIAVKQSGDTPIVLTAAFVTIICLVLSISFVMDLDRKADA